MLNNSLLDDAYANYFNKNAKKDESITTKINPTPQPQRHVHKDIMISGEPYNDPTAIDVHELMNAEEDCLELAARLIQKLLDTAWGSEWGLITLDSPTGLNADEATLPCIVVDMNNREIAEKRSPKPTRIREIKEEINGVETGDTFLIYRQWYDCILEFNFYGKNNLEARRLMQRFETLMASSVGVLKKEGISEVFFLKEVSPKQSINYSQDVAMKCTMYYYRFEKDYVIRASSLNRIEMEFNTQHEGFTDASASDIYNNPAIQYQT